MTRSLKDRLVDWEERRERGETVSAADLCTDAPELAAELGRLIGLLEAAERLLDVNLTTPVTAMTTADAPPRLARLPARIGRYEVRAELGRGGTCVVYLAWDPELRREVALKVVHDQTPLGGQHQAAVIARLVREAQTLAGLRHDHIVAIYEPGLSGGRPYFVLEYVRGGSLRGRLAELSVTGPRAFVPLLHQVARAMQYAHERGYLHRDLKPGNILLADDGRALVSDFGLAKLLADVPAAEGDPTADTAPYLPPEPADVSARLTATGSQPGTPAYMAPEQYDSAFGDVGPATDVWALGVILYELLTGQKPFRGRTWGEVRRQVCGGQLVRPRRRRRGVNRRLEAIVLRCLRTDPRRRYRAAGEVATALAAWQRRWVWRLAAAAVLVAGLAALGVFLWVRETSPERQHQRETAVPLAALKRNEPATFIPSGTGRAPAYLVRAGEQGTNIVQTADGLVIDGRAMCCLVELCPQVPLTDYRLRARLRLMSVHTHDRAWGVYVNHSRVNTTPGPQHYFEAAYFLDTAGKTELQLPEPPAVRAALSQRWFSYHHKTPAPGGEEYPWRDWTGNADRLESFVTGPVPEGAWKASWRTIEIDVHGDEVSAHCSGGGLAGELGLGTIRARERRSFLRALTLNCPDLRDIKLDISGTGAGICVGSSTCQVSEFVIEPLPAR